MNDIERAIEVLKEFNDVKPVLTEELEDATDLAISALEKQITKKPKIEEDFKDTRIATCSMCNCWVNEFRKYCPDCGQKLDWSEVQE